MSPLWGTDISLTWAPFLTSDMTSTPPPLWTYQSRDSKDTSCGSVHMMDWMKILTMLLTHLQERCKVRLMTHWSWNTWTGKPFFWDMQNQIKIMTSLLLQILRSFRNCNYIYMYAINFLFCIFSSSVCIITCNFKMNVFLFSWLVYTIGGHDFQIEG